jgi:DNA-binding transcriptional LysR family regulator
VDIRDLDYFLACCEAGSFTAAARNAHIVQSAMSSAIARLERDLGVPLFDRSSTPISLTEHGTALQGAAHRILDAVQAARDEVAAVSGHVRGTVTLGCTLTTGPLDLAGVLSRVRNRYPDVIIKLRQHSTGSAGNLQALRDGSVDIALYAVAGNAPADEPPRGIVLHPLVSEAVVFVCRPDHPLAGRDEVAVTDLRDERLLRFPPGWGVRAIVDNALGATQSAVEIVDYGLMLRLVRAGFGTTLVPLKGVEGERGEGLRAIPVDDPCMSWNLTAGVCADRRLTAATRTLLDALIQGAAEAGRQAPRGQLPGPWDRLPDGGFRPADSGPEQQVGGLNLAHARYQGVLRQGTRRG